MADGRIIIDTMLDTNGLEQNLGKLGTVASKGLKVFSAAIATATTAIGAFGLKSIKLASDLDEVQNVVDVTFGDGAKDINKWASEAGKAFGLSTLSAKQYTGTLGAMLKSSGIAQESLVGMSEDLVGLAGDFASFYNLDHETAFEKIRSGISGETEPLKQLGINMSVTNMEAYALSQGINKSWNEMSQAEQTLLRYNYLMSVSSDAQGDFARTSDSLANQVRIAQLNFQSLSADIGSLLLPVAKEAVTSFNDVASKLRESFQSEEMKESVKKLAEAVGELVTKIANFLADHLDELIDGLSWILNNANNIAAGIVAISVGLKAMNVANAIMGVVKAFKLAKAAEEGLTVAQWLLNIAMEANPIGIIIGIISALVAAFIYLWNTSDSFRQFWIDCWNSIKQFFSDCWNGIMNFFTETIPAWIDSVIEWFKGIPEWFASLPSKIGYALGQAIAQIIQCGADIWNWVTTELPKIILGIIKWWQELPGKIWTCLKETVVKVVQWILEMQQKTKEGIKNVVTGIIDKVKELPSKMMETGKNIVKGLWEGIKSVKSWIMDKISGFVDGIVGGIKDFFGIHSPSRRLRDEVGVYAAQGVGVGFEDETDKVEKGMTDKMKEVVGRIQGVITAENYKQGQLFTVAKEDTYTEDNNSNSTGMIQATFNIDGKPVMEAIAPYQNVLEEYNVGRS